MYVSSVDKSKCIPCDQESPVSSLRYVLVVPEGEHYLMYSFGILRYPKTSLVLSVTDRNIAVNAYFGYSRAESKVWKRRRNDVEGGAVDALGQKRQELRGFNKTSWPCCLSAA